MQKENIFICPPCGESTAVRGQRGLSHKGFTLIELLVVVLIIGILAAVALPQYQKAVVKSRLAAIQPMLTSIKQAEETYYLANGEYTDDITKLDLEHGCKTIFEDTFACDQSFIIDSINTSLNPSDSNLRAFYCPNDINNWQNCKFHRDFIYTVWFENSTKPNQIECDGYTTLGNSVCKGIE